MKTKPLVGIALLTSLAACTVGPDYTRPSVELSPSFKESDGWKPSTPADDSERGPWWSIYHDAILDKLEAQVEVSNQNLKASEAAYVQAAAAARAAHAGLYPSVTLNPSAGRSASYSSAKGSVIANSFSLTSAFSWDLDVWGKIRRTIEANVATAQASAGDLASARLSAQATLAIDYFELRIQDQLRHLLEASVEAYGQSLRIAQNQYRAGVASRADVAQAETLMKTTQAQLVNVGVLRAQLEHAIAVLTGRPPALFSIDPLPSSADLPLLGTVPVVPVNVPSALLERRPDIAAAERRVAAANAEIGVNMAAFYPDLSLSASLGYMNTSIDGLFKTANRIWSFGPQASQILFDGGLRDAQIDESQAAWTQSVATYRQTVLTAFQQVEDNLAALKILEGEATIQVDAIHSAREAERLILNQYKAGTVPYTTVVTAQTAALSDEESALTVLENRLVASISLVQALGGGWESSALPQDPLAQDMKP